MARCVILLLALVAVFATNTTEVASTTETPEDTNTTTETPEDTNTTTSEDTTTTVETPEDTTTAVETTTITPEDTSTPETPETYTAQCLSKSKLRVMQDAVRERINAATPFNEEADDFDNERADVIGGMVRLSFHDAGTYVAADPDSGGADGCVDLYDVENGGLEQVITTIAEPLYRPFANDISRADFWVVMANTALQVATEMGTCEMTDDCCAFAGCMNRVCDTKRKVCYQVTDGEVNFPKISSKMPFRYGRKDCFDTAYSKENMSLPVRDRDAGKLPHNRGWDHIKEVFVIRGGFTVRETVALLGAHTLGRCQADNSGFDGPWVHATKADKLDDQYWLSLLSMPWFKVTTDFNNNDKQQWTGVEGYTPLEGDNQQMMLHVDAALVVSNANDSNCVAFNFEGETQSAQCVLNTEARAHVQAFYDNYTQWVIEFQQAMQKLQEHTTPGVNQPLSKPTSCDNNSDTSGGRYSNDDPCVLVFCGEGYVCEANANKTDFSCNCNDASCEGAAGASSAAKSTAFFAFSAFLPLFSFIF